MGSFRTAGILLKSKRVESQLVQGCSAVGITEVVEFPVSTLLVFGCSDAQGSVDVMIDYGVHRWDISALKVIVEEAGGTFTDWQGQQGLDKKDVLATNGVLFPTVLEILQKLE